MCREGGAYMSTGLDSNRRRDDEDLAVEREVADVFREESKGRRIGTAGRASRKKGFKGAVKFPADVTTDKGYKRSGEVQRINVGQLSPAELTEMLNNSPAVRQMLSERIEREHRVLNEGLSYAVGVTVGPLLAELNLAISSMCGWMEELLDRLERMESVIVELGSFGERLAGAAAGAGANASRPRRTLTRPRTVEEMMEGLSARAEHPQPTSRVQSPRQGLGRRARRRGRRDWSDPQQVILEALDELQAEGIDIERATDVLAVDSTLYQRAVKRYGKWQAVLDLYQAQKKETATADRNTNTGKKLQQEDQQLPLKAAGGEE